ncbi:hypothetical protein GQ600_15279 [Phytophthora cactorum]|nr:hypothetical protein GQ600_15279 [Phytophthora cactorum]
MDERTGEVGGCLESEGSEVDGCAAYTHLDPSTDRLRRKTCDIVAYINKCVIHKMSVEMHNPYLKCPPPWNQSEDHRPCDGSHAVLRAPPGLLFHRRLHHGARQRSEQVGLHHDPAEPLRALRRLCQPRALGLQLQVRVIHCCPYLP